MKLEDIEKLWSEDANINKERLDDESLNISKLHAKYHQIYTNERLVKYKYDAELKQLKLEKFEFYTQGPSNETKEKGWRLPPVGKVLKSEVGNYLEADPDIINLTLKIGLQNEKITLLESVIKVLMSRGFALKTAMEFIRFTNGY